MRAGLESFPVISMAGWLNQKQQQVIDYLVEENRVLREQVVGASRSTMISDVDWRQRVKGWTKKF
jgi:hypothetical protein